VLLNRFDLRELSPEAGVPVKGGSSLLQKTPWPALDGVAAGETIARKKRFGRRGSSRAASQLIKCEKCVWSLWLWIELHLLEQVLAVFGAETGAADDEHFRSVQEAIETC